MKKINFNNNLLLIPFIVFGVFLVFAVNYFQKDINKYIDQNAIFSSMRSHSGPVCGKTKGTCKVGKASTLIPIMRVTFERVPMTYDIGEKRFETQTWENYYWQWDCYVNDNYGKAKWIECECKRKGCKRVLWGLGFRCGNRLCIKNCQYPYTKRADGSGYDPNPISIPLIGISGTFEF